MHRESAIGQVLNAKALAALIAQELAGIIDCIPTAGLAGGVVVPIGALVSGGIIQYTAGHAHQLGGAMLHG